MNKVYKIVTQKIIDKLNERVIPLEKALDRPAGLCDQSGLYLK